MRAPACGAPTSRWRAQERNARHRARRHQPTDGVIPMEPTEKSRNGEATERQRGHRSALARERAAERACGWPAHEGAAIEQRCR